MKFALKWAAVLAAYVLTTVALFWINPNLARTASWTNVLWCVGLATAASAAAFVSFRASRTAKQFYKRGARNYGEASFAWINTIHGKYRTEPAGEGLLKLICNCKAVIGVFPADDPEQVFGLGRKHVEAQVAEIGALVSKQWKLYVENDGKVKQDSAV